MCSNSILGPKGGTLGSKNKFDLKVSKSMFLNSKICLIAEEKQFKVIKFLLSSDYCHGLWNVWKVSFSNIVSIQANFFTSDNTK